MATEQQIAANRRNALLSTGPRTPEGKAAVRFNALTLGLSAKSIILNPGDQPALERLLASLAESFPEEDERYLIEEIAVTRLELSRLRALEVEAYTSHAQHPTWNEYLKNLEMISRMKVRLQRHYEKCAATLRRLHPPQKTQDQTQFVENLNTPAPPALEAETQEPPPESQEPIAESRPPIADRRPPIAESRQPKGETRPPKAETRPPIAESQSVPDLLHAIDNLRPSQVIQMIEALDPLTTRRKT